MDFSHAHQAFIKLFANDYFFFSVIAVCFFISGFLAGRTYLMYKYRDYFDHCLESDRILRSELAKLRKKLSESEQKQ